MAIRIKGTTVVDDNRNFSLNSLAFSDNSTLSSLGLAPGTLKWTLDNPNAFDLSGLNDTFGYSVAASDQYLIVGVYQEDDSSGSDSGKAYIFNVATGALVWTLNNPNAFGTGGSDWFGRSVAISGNYAIVGAMFEDETGGNTDSGKAYIFDVRTGALVQTLNNPNAYSTSASDFFGVSVAISGNNAIVGASQEDDAGGTESGRAYIFNVTTGALVYTLVNPNAYSTSLNDRFGSVLSISGNYALVGAWQEDDAGGASSGKVYIYDVSTSALLFTLNNPNAYELSGGDQFGTSISVSGNFAIIGANGEGDTGGASSGKAYIFNVTTGALVWTLNNPNAYSTSPADFFGTSVSISGNSAIVGAYFEDDAGGGQSGKAYIFNVSTGALVATLNNPYFYDRVSNDQFGWSVAINSNMAFAGALFANSAQGTDSGAVYSFNLSNFSPMYTFTNPVNNFDGSSQGNNDAFGETLAISGNYAIVGANAEDDFTNTGSGKAYIFNVTTGQLVWTLNNPNAYGTSAGDLFGQSVAISGNYALVGTYQEDGGGISSGIVYVFNVATGQLIWTLNNPNPYDTAQSDLFGTSISISGNYAIVSARNEDDAGGTESGKAYIFNVTTGQLIWTLNNPNSYGTSAGDLFGQSVAISGNFAIVASTSAVDSASGIAYIYNVTTGQLIWTLMNPNTYSSVVGDNFGKRVAISDNYAIVSAYWEDDASGVNSGKVYVYNVTTGALLWTLNNPNAYSTGLNDEFGVTLALSGNYAIVGAYNEDDASGTSSGKAYIFDVRTSQLLYTLNNPNAYSTSQSDVFGVAVDISSNFAIVGSYESSSKGSNSGRAYIFNLATPEKYTGFTSLSGLEKLADQNTIVDRSYLKWTLNNPNAYSTSAGDQFGYAAAIFGNYAAFSSVTEDVAAGVDSGVVYVYNVTTGQLLYTLNNPNAFSTVTNDQFGTSITISKDYILVGAFQEDDASGIISGKAYLYNISTGTLIRTYNNPNPYSTSDSDRFGWTLSMTEVYTIIGAYLEDDAGGNSSGKAYVYNTQTGTLLWTLNNQNAYSTSLDDNFGKSVAVFDNFAIVGAPGESDTSGTYSGKAYIYNLVTGTLITTLNNPNIVGTSSLDFFGNWVALSGRYALVSANSEDTPTTDSGVVYVYDRYTNALISTIISPIVTSGSFGLPMAVSGNYLIVGAPGANSSSGFVSIFNILTGVEVFRVENPNPYSTGDFDYFGYAVGISGNYFVCSAPFEDDASFSSIGRAYIFSINNLNYKSLEDKLISLFHY